MKYKVRIEKISYVYATVDAENEEDAFDYAEGIAEHLFNRGVESGPDAFIVSDDIDEEEES